MNAAEFKRVRERVKEAQRLRDAADDLARRRNLLLQATCPKLRIDRVGDKLQAILDENDPPELHEAIARGIVQAVRAAEAKLEAQFEAL